MPRFPAGLLAAFLVIPVTLAAQNPPAAAADTGNVMLLDITVHPGEYEPHIVFLQRGIVYRASFSGQGVEIRVRSFAGRQLPFIVSLTNSVDASGGSEFEIYPQSDGDIEFTEAFNGDKVPVTFRLWKDARSTERGRRSAEEGYWELGIDGLVGWHGDFDAQDGGAAGAGGTVGGCLGVRNGPGPLGAINGCIVGAEWKVSGRVKGVFFFTEPQIRLSHGRRTDTGWRYDWGLLFRYAAFADGSDDGNFSPGMFGVGAYVARDLRDLNGRGWRITFTARSDNMSELVDDGFGSFVNKGRRWSPAFQIGVGRYR